MHFELNCYIVSRYIYIMIFLNVMLLNVSHIIANEHNSSHSNI